MKNKSFSIYTFCIAFIFFIAILFFVASLCKEYKNGYMRTNQIFDNLSASLATAVTQYENEQNEFQAAFEQALGSYSNYDNIILYKNEKIIFAYPQNIVENDANKFSRKYNFSVPHKNDVYKVSATMYLLRPISIFHYAQFSFVLVLVATILAIVLLAYLYFFKTDLAKEKIYQTDEQDAFTQFDTSDLDTNYDNENTDNVNEFSTKTAVNEAYTSFNLEPETKQNQVSSSSSLSSSTDETVLAANASAPQGLFSPETGFGWQEYLEPRLESELIRATASESDLSLLMIKIPQLKFTDEITKKICKYLTQYFQCNDLLFECSADGYAIILENTTNENALNTAETIHKEIDDILSSTGYNCYIGIASRSVRIITANRLITEATEALKCAMNENDLPIVAFRANDEKYREYIESQN